MFQRSRKAQAALGSKQLYFLSGLPRTGSTVLASLFNQHPDIYASSTSPLMDLLCATDATINKLRTVYAFDDQLQHQNIYRGVIGAFYDHIAKPVIFDKNRGWPRNGLPLRGLLPNTKFICTVRPIAEIIASFVKLVEQAEGRPNSVDIELNRRGQPLTTSCRAQVAWESYVLEAYQSLKFGMEHMRDRILLVSYADIVSRAPEVLDRVLRFTGIRPYRGFDFERIENTNPEKDEEGWVLPGLHTIRPRLSVTSTPPEVILGADLAKHYQQYDLQF